MPIAPPRSRIPIVSRRIGWLAISAQMSPTYPITAVTTSPRDESRVAIVGVAGVCKKPPFFKTIYQTDEQPYGAAKGQKLL